MPNERIFPLLAFLFFPTLLLVVILFYSFKQQPPQVNNLGDVRYSVLEPAVFEASNPGWKLMDGQVM
jgi:hypothetical protein